jgi:tripartite-type tricarboxylate transporter receptor subunit TctC
MRIWIGAFAILTATHVQAQTPPPFYEGKTLSIYVGSSAGGGYDMYGRALARYIAKYIPGNPTIIVRNMPGAGGLQLASYLYNLAPKDGTEIGELEYGAAFTPMLTGTAVKFDPMKLGWLGSMDKFTPIVVAWHNAPFTKAADLFERSMTVGSSGAGSSTAGYPFSLNAILGTKFKVISGYPGSAEMTLAMERGEVEGIASWCWTCLKSEKPDWVSNNKARVLMQLALEGDPELTQQGIPTVLQLAKTEEPRRLLRIIFAGVGFARPFTAPPDIPPERLETLREAFRKASLDPGLVAEMSARGNTVQFVPPKRIIELLTGAEALDKDQLGILQAAYSGRDQH